MVISGVALAQGVTVAESAILRHLPVCRGCVCVRCIYQVYLHIRVISWTSIHFVSSTRLLQRLYFCSDCSPLHRVGTPVS